MSNDTVTIEVDGQPLTARKGQMLIQVTDANGIYVPRFCYHDKLSVAANCRMCLVDVEKAPKPLPACATPVMDGMKVRTRSKLALEAQKSVMEFLLINHPLDCPICDQGGECELQDLAMGYGRDVSRYQEQKRVVRDKDIGPLVQTEMTRCIHCTRCVRFGEEIAGVRELGATGRGEFMEIGTYVEHAMASELSGNIIDLCPVGALTSKPFRFSARTWEMTQYPGIAPHDAIGSNVHFHVQNGRVKRVVPAENEAINEVWLSDRDRFSYEGLYSEDRLSAPMIRDAGGWREVDWDTAFAFVGEQLGAILRSEPARVGGLIGPTSTLEEMYLFQKLLRGAGCANVDHRVRQLDFSDQDEAPVFPSLGLPIAGLEQLDAALVIGGNVRKEQPLINHRLRKAALRGARIMHVNVFAPESNFPLAGQLAVAPGKLVGELAGICRALAEAKSDALAGEPWLADVRVSDGARHIAQRLAAGGRVAVLLGNTAGQLPDASAVRFLAGIVARLAGASFGYLGAAANGTGAWVAGAVPHRGPGGKAITGRGLHALDMAASALRGFVLCNVEPESDSASPAALLAALRGAECVVALTPWASDAARDYAHVLLPVAGWAETDGTFINVEGVSQSWCAVAQPPGEARPAWKVMRRLADALGVAGCAYDTTYDITRDVAQDAAGSAPNNTSAWRALKALPTAATGLQRATIVPMNAADALVRRAAALQETPDSAAAALRLNGATATRNGVGPGQRARLTQGNASLVLPVVVDESVADDVVLLHGGQAGLAALGPWFGTVTVAPA